MCLYVQNSMWKPWRWACDSNLLRKGPCFFHPCDPHKHASQVWQPPPPLSPSPAQTSCPEWTQPGRESYIAHPKKKWANRRPGSYPLNTLGLPQETDTSLTYPHSPGSLILGLCLRAWPVIQCGKTQSSPSTSVNPFFYKLRLLVRKPKPGFLLFWNYQILVPK